MTLDFIVRPARKEDFKAIRSLQKANHFSSVTEDYKAREGFVSVETSIKMLDRLNEDIGICVAEKAGNIVGYEMPLGLQHAAQLPLLKPFIVRFKTIDYDGNKVSDYNVVIEGQILVAKGEKGQGITEALHEQFVNGLKGKYDLLITEISDQNPRSLHVHTNKLGLKVIDEYAAEGRNWYVLAQDLR